MRDTQTLVGNLIDVNEGDFLLVTGEEVVHPRFGSQVKVQSYQTVLPQDEEGIVNYLSSGRFKGVGKKTAEKIVKHFGKDTFEVLEQDPDLLNDVKGIKKKLITEIKKNTRSNLLIRDLTVKLSPFGIGQATIYNIYKEFGEDVFGILETNPYILIERIRGVGFRIADTVARVFGIQGNDPNRVQAGLDFLMSQIEQKNGDLYIEEAELYERAAALLDVDSDDVAKGVDALCRRGGLVQQEIPEKV